MAGILDSVRSKYGAVAESKLSSNDSGVKAAAEAFGYSAEELTSIPAEANMGLSCGNPTATAHLRLRGVGEECPVPHHNGVRGQMPLRARSAP
jgi:hypothetical protein